MSDVEGILYEPRNRAARLYTLEGSKVNIPKAEAIKKAKLRFASDFGYDLDELVGKEVEVTSIDDSKIRTIIVTVKHSVYRGE